MRIFKFIWHNKGLEWNGGAFLEVLADGRECFDLFLQSLQIGLINVQILASHVAEVAADTGKPDVGPRKLCRYKSKIISNLWDFESVFHLSLEEMSAVLSKESVKLL
jgi:hypothetical protein